MVTVDTLVSLPVDHHDADPRSLAVVLEEPELKPGDSWSHQYITDVSDVCSSSSQVSSVGSDDVFIDDKGSNDEDEDNHSFTTESISSRTSWFQEHYPDWSSSQSLSSEADSVR